MSRELGYFDLDEHCAALSASGDPLERLSPVIDIELFRAPLNQVLRRSDGCLSAMPTSHRRSGKTRWAAGHPSTRR
jgi:hypothetical protein